MEIGGEVDSGQEITSLVGSKVTGNAVPHNLTIEEGNYTMIKLPSENFRIIKLLKDSTVNLGKFGSFNVNEILGRPFGFTYEIIDDGKVRSVNNEFELDGSEENLEYSETNQLLNDDPATQALTMKEIEHFKSQGFTGQDLINKVKGSHASFKNKTLYSQEKYVKRKQQKFLQRFTPEAITSSELIDIYLDKDPAKIQGMSVESLGLVMSQANIRPGGTYLVVDDLCGIVVAACIERMAGQGQIVVAHDTEHPNLDALRYMNYPDDVIERVVTSINWLEFLHPQEVEPFRERSQEELASIKASYRGQYYRKKQKHENFERVRALIDGAKFESLVVATSLNPATLLPRLIPCVAGSSPIVIYNEYKENLVETTHVLQSDLRVIAPTIVETRVRQYQTLPGRMHPHMTSRGGGGYILYGIRVFPSNVNAVSRGKKRKR
jgi:tRNA (adenine-N(1)-)-methyltransferase non-catalytic subunit